MDSIGDRVGSNRWSNLRRYTPVQSRIQCWPKGRMISDGHPQIEGQVPRELTYQAQLAACTYLGYSPREFSASHFRQQAITADPSRSLELHMHHHHHHYLASPTSPFSQTNSATLFGEAELAATAADVTVRSSSQGPLRSHGHSDTNQRSTQSVLWLKDQVSEDEVEKPPSKLGKDLRGESHVTRGAGLIKEDCGSQISGTSDIRSIEYPNKLSWSRDHDSEQQERSAREMTSCCLRQTLKMSKHSNASSFRIAKKQKGAGRRCFRSNSDESSASQESVAPTLNETRSTSQRACLSVIEPWKANSIHGKAENEELKGRTSTLDRVVPQASESPLSIGKVIKHSAQPSCTAVDGQVDRSSINEDTTTSESISFRESDKVSPGLLCSWASIGPSNSEIEKQKIPYCPYNRTSRRNFGARASRRQERRTFKDLGHAEAREDETKKHPSVYEPESQVETGKTARCTYEREGNPPGDTFQVQKVERQSCLPCVRPAASKTKKHADHEHVKVLDSAPPERNGIIEDIRSADDRSGTEKLKSEYMQDPVWSRSLYTPWTNDVKSSKSSTQNRFRQAVEAAWKTSLGTKNEPESDSFETISDVGGFPQESPQEKMNSQIVGRVAPMHESPTDDDTARVAEEGIRDLLDERALFRAKFKEEMEQGVTDRLRLQELLQLEKIKLEATERELREVKRSFQEALLAGAKMNKTHASEGGLENQLLNTHIAAGVVKKWDDTPLKLKSESEARMAAEAKASYFEESAKAADEKIQTLLKERNWFYSRLKGDLENKCTDTVANKRSMEQESNSNGRSALPQEKSEAQASAASSVPDALSEAAPEGGKRVAHDRHDKASKTAGLRQELEAEDADRDRLRSSLKLEESRPGSVKGTRDRNSKVPPLVVSSKQETSPKFGTKALESEHQRNNSTPLATDSEIDKQVSTIGCGNSNPKSGKKRSFSPASSSKLQTWEQNLSCSLKTERRRLEDGKTARVFDISPNLDDRGDSSNKSGCKLELRDSEDTESTSSSDSSSDFVVRVGGEEELVSRKLRSYNCAISSQQDKHLDSQEDEREGTKSEEGGSETDENSVHSIDRSYQLSESDRSKKQSDLSAAESASTSIYSEEPDAHRRNDSRSPESHSHENYEGTQGSEPCDNNCNAQRQYSPGRHGENVESGQGNPLRAEVQGFDDHLMMLPSRWKRAAKAELRRIIHEHELTWKIAEDALDDLGRRLELLERYKMELQDNLSSCRIHADRERIWTRLENRFERSPKGFSSLYDSPIFEDRLGPVERETSGRSSKQADTSGPIAHERHHANDLEIQKLKADIEELKNQLSVRRSSSASSPVKKDFRYSSSSPPPTPPLPPPPPPATPAAPPTPPTVPDCKHQAFQEFSDGRQVTLTGALEHARICQAEIVGFPEAELVHAQAENVKTVTSQATRRGRNGCSKRKVDRHGYHEDGLPEDCSLENRSRVPVPDDETVERDCWVRSDVHENGKRDRATLLNFGELQSSTVTHQNPPGYGNGSVVPSKSDEGELEVLRGAVRKISNIFWHQEGKLKSLKEADNVVVADQKLYHEMRNFYVNLLKEMSDQLGELCGGLQTDSCENVHNHGTMVRPISGGSEMENLRAALQAAERQIEEEATINSQLKQKLNAGNKHLSKIVEEHAEELMKKEKTVNFAQKLNLRLANEMSVTESNLAELRARYKSLVASLESQLKDAREEVMRLQRTLSDLDLEVERNQSLVTELERAGQEKELQIQELSERMQAYQCENERNQNMIIDLERAGEEKKLQIHRQTERMQALQNESYQMSEEKFELLKNIQELRREVDNHQRRIQELVDINEELMEFAQSKEDEVMSLTNEVTSLQQVSKGKSDEANKLAVEAAISLRELIEARRQGESYRTHCNNLKSKLQETEQELMAREDALDRLTRHLGSTIEGQDLISEEKEQLLLSLSNVQYKERRMDDQIKQSKVIIEDLEDKLSCLEQELSKARIEIIEMRARGKEALAIEKEAGEMRCRIHQLEEEIMEKEGQISILKSSYPGEFESAF